MLLVDQQDAQEDELGLIQLKRVTSLINHRELP